jgi:hypothetical protein
MDSRRLETRRHRRPENGTDPARPKEHADFPLREALALPQPRGQGRATFSMPLPHCLPASVYWGFKKATNAFLSLFAFSEAAVGTCGPRIAANQPFRVIAF